MDIAQAASEMGRKGGTTTKKRHGVEHYQKLAKHMNEVLAEKRLKQQNETKDKQGIKKN